MAFKDFLLSHFPHRWLKEKAHGTTRLFGGLGKSMDYAETYVECLVRNSSTRTVVELLPDLENEYGLVIDPSAETEKRRAKIIAKKRMMDCPITMPELTNMFAALSITAQIENFYNEHLMRIVILSNELEISYREIFDILFENIRAHVAFEMVAKFTTQATATLTATHKIGSTLIVHPLLDTEYTARAEIAAVACIQLMSASLIVHAPRPEAAGTYLYAITKTGQSFTAKPRKERENE